MLHSSARLGHYGYMSTEQDQFTLALARELRIAHDDSPLATRKELSAASGIPPRSLKRYLDGEREVPLTELRSLARTLGVSLTAMLDRADERADDY